MNKHITFLIILLTGIIVFLYVVQTRFSETIDKATQAEQQFLIKQIIAADLITKITVIEALSYKIPLTANKSKILKIYMRTLDKEILEVHNLINLLESGGTYTKIVPLNIAGRNSYTKTFYFDRQTSIPIEVIRLKPQIELLRQFSRELDQLTSKKIKAITHHEPLMLLGKKITLLTKSTDSIFRRMKEDGNQLYYEAQEKLNKKNMEISRKKIRYNFVIFATIFIVFVLLFMILKYFIRELYNKLYVDRLTGLHSRAKLEGTEFREDALLFLIDLDDFSDINSLYGMDFGDKVLRNQADKLKHFDSRATSFRVAGDIFGILYRAFPDDDQQVQKKIIEIQSRLKDCTKCNMELSVTIGAARGSDCLHDAYTALDIANTKNEPFWVYHDESTYMREVKFNRLWHDELKAALDNDTIVPFFHPIVDRDRNVIHYETLMRLKRSNGKTEYISPSVFLDVAMKTKLYLPISRRLIQKAFEFFSDKPEVSFTINLSYDDMAKEDIQGFLHEMITRHHAQNRIVFEVLETSFIDNPILLEDFFTTFREYGVKFAIDDFGAGYSNLKRVVALNPDYLKIDGSLIQAMLRDKRSHKMVENIVEYAREFGIKTVAEYVSSPEIFEECKRLNMDYCQGYYFAEPSPQLEL
jgi:diguanylate cyclase (GGDEF)-like protein